MRLLNIMERHIRDGLHLQLQCSVEQVRIFFDFKCCELETKVFKPIGKCTSEQ